MSVYSILPLIASVTNLFLGGVVIGKNPNSRVNQAWAFLSLCLAIWSFGLFALFSSINSSSAYSWMHLYNLGIVLVPSAFLYFVLVFTDSLTKYWKNVVISAYVASAIFFLLGYTSLFNEAVTKFSWGYYPVPGMLNILFDMWFGGFLVLAIVILLKHYTESAGRKRNQYKYIITAAFICSLTCTTNFLPIWKIDVYPIGPVGVFFGGLIITYAIIRYQLMDIRIIIRKSAIYSVLTALVAAAYIVSVFVFQIVLKGLTGYTSLLPAIAVSFIIALTFVPAQRRIQLTLDKVFFKRKYEYRQVIKSASEGLRLKVNPINVSNFLVDTVMNTLQSERGWLMILDRHSKKYIVSAARNLPKSASTSISFSKDGQLAELLRNKQTYIDIDDPDKRTLRRDIDKSERIKILKLQTKVIVPLNGKSELVGMLFLGSKKSGDIYNQDDAELLTILCNQAALSIKNTFLYEELQESYLNTVRSLVTALEAKDEYTKGHSERVANFAREIAQELGFIQQEAELLYEVSLLHDVGKIGVSEQILNKPSKLSSTEYAQIRTHAMIGEKIISGVESLKEGLSAVRHHHERLNGDGYPDGLSQIEIPIEARVLAVADAFDAMTTKRPYRSAMTTKEAVIELKTHACDQFDPRVVRAFIVILARHDSKSGKLRFLKSYKKSKPLKSRSA